MRGFVRRLPHAALGSARSGAESTSLFLIAVEALNSIRGRDPPANVPRWRRIPAGAECGNSRRDEPPSLRR